MEKKIKDFEVKHGIEWQYKELTIKELRIHIDKLEELGVTHVEISAQSNGYESYDIEIEAICRRIETDCEFDERVSEERDKVNRVVHRELTELKKLKAKYPNN